MQGKHELIAKNKNILYIGKEPNQEKINLVENSSHINKIKSQEDKGITNKNLLGNKSFLDTIYKKTLPNTNLINKLNLELVKETSKLLDFQKEIELINNIKNIQELKSHRQSNKNLKIGNVNNEEIFSKNKDKIQRKISNSFNLEKNESSSKAKELLNYNINNNLCFLNSKPLKISEDSKNILIKNNNSKITKNNLKSHLNPNSNSSSNIKNIQIQFSKTAINFNNLKNLELNNNESSVQQQNREIIKNKYEKETKEQINKNINGENNKNIEKMQIENKIIDEFNSDCNKENNNNQISEKIKIDKNDDKSFDKNIMSRSNSKNKHKTKFKSNKKLENHLGNTSKDFFVKNNQIQHQKIESSSNSSGLTKFILKAKVATNTNSNLDLTKDNKANFNISLRNFNNKNNKSLIQTIKPKDENKSYVNSHIMEKITNNEIDEYYRLICVGNKENDKCNNVQYQSTKNGNQKIKKIIDFSSLTKINNLNTNLERLDNLKNSEIKKLRVNLNENITNNSNNNKNNLEDSVHDLNKSRKKIIKIKGFSKNSNKNSKNNSSDKIKETQKIDKKIDLSPSKMNANLKLDDEENYFNKNNILFLNNIETNKTKGNFNKENLIFNHYKKNSNNFLDSHNYDLKLKNKIIDTNEKFFISNSAFDNKINPKSNLNYNIFEVENNLSDINKNIFLEKVKFLKDINKQDNCSKDRIIYSDRNISKNIGANSSFANNSNSNIKKCINCSNNNNQTNKKEGVRMMSPLSKIDSKKLKIMIISKETNQNCKNLLSDTNRLNILGTNSNSNQITEDEKGVKNTQNSKIYNNGNEKINNFNFSDGKNIKFEINSKKGEIEENIKNSEKKNNSNINKTYSSLAKKLKNKTKSKHILECSSNSNFEIIGNKGDKKVEEEKSINRNKSYDITKNSSNKKYKNNKNLKDIEYEIINQNFNLNIGSKTNSNSNSNNEEIFHNINNDAISNNFNIENEINKDYSNLDSNKKNHENLLSKINLFNSVNENNFNTKTTKETLKQSYYQNKNFSQVEIEGPEELHMLSINLHQQNKKLLYKFEKMDDTIRTEKENICTVYLYDNGVDI